jgi:DNA-binding transcriptional ArsR family regulator
VVNEPKYLRDHAYKQVRGHADLVHDQNSAFQMPDDSDVQVAADAFRMLSDKNRIKILVALLQGESSVNCLAELIDASPSAVSQHLAKLRLAGLVTVRREGTFAYYAAANSHVQRLLDEALSHADHAARRVDSSTPHRHHITT